MNDREYKLVVAALLCAGHANKIFGLMIGGPHGDGPRTMLVVLSTDQYGIVQVAEQGFDAWLRYLLSGKEIPGFQSLDELMAVMNEIDGPLAELVGAGLLPLE